MIYFIFIHLGMCELFKNDINIYNLKRTHLAGLFCSTYSDNLLQILILFTFLQM